MYFAGEEGTYVVWICGHRSCRLQSGDLFMSVRDGEMQDLPKRLIKISQIIATPMIV